jgi:hypothetical protein
MFTLRVEHSFSFLHWSKSRTSEVLNYLYMALAFEPTLHSKPPESRSPGLLKGPHLHVVTHYMQRQGQVGPALQLI